MQNMLTRVPNLDTLSKLRELWLAGNRITTIEMGAFKGTPLLVLLDLGSNLITSVAAGVFTELAALQILPTAFAPKNADGAPWKELFGNSRCHVPCALLPPPHGPCDRSAFECCWVVATP